MAACDNVYEQWCAAGNFFGSRAAAAAWASEHRIRAAVCSLDETAERARAEWSNLVGASPADA